MYYGDSARAVQLPDSGHPRWTSPPRNPSRSAGVDAYQLAKIYAARGDGDAAFRWLDQAWRQRDSGVTWTKIDPFLVPLRADPRYRDFLHKVKLPLDTGRRHLNKASGAGGRPGACRCSPLPGP